MRCVSSQLCPRSYACPSDPRIVTVATLAMRCVSSQLCPRSYACPSDHETSTSWGSKINSNFVTFLLGVQDLVMEPAPTNPWILGDRETRNVGSRPRCDAIGVVPVGHDLTD
jgi:hypothetical protein